MQKKTENIFRSAKKCYSIDMSSVLVPNPGDDILRSSTFHENQNWPCYNRVH